ncbi:yqjQ [Scenedesmus sp. PABB004]|nr:yqjQ [Scenedesmus sp. PABB004]
MAGLQERGCRVLRLDVTDAGSVRDCVARVLAEAGRIDVLINNAGVVLLGPTAEVPLSLVKAGFDANVFGLLAMCQAVAPAMVAQRAGRIVNIGSLTGFTPVPLRGIYSATKAAVMRLTDALRVELSMHGVQVLLIAPGFIRSHARDTAAAVAAGYADAPSSLWPGWLGALERAMARLLVGAVPAERYADALADVVLAPRVPRYWTAWALVLAKDARTRPACSPQPGAARTAAEQRRAPPQPASPPAGAPRAAAEPDLPAELAGTRAGAAPRPAAAWTPAAGPPARWLAAAHGPALAAEAAAAAAAATAAHRQVAGALEQRRAALLRELGAARELDLRLLLSLVGSYADDVQARALAGRAAQRTVCARAPAQPRARRARRAAPQALLAERQAAALRAHAAFAERLAASAAAAMGGSVEAALAAAHEAQASQAAHLEAAAAAQLQACRLSGAQQAAAALELAAARAREAAERREAELTQSWAGRCEAAEAAAERQAALRGAAESECARLRTELAAARREAAAWRARWDKDCGSAGGGRASADGGSQAGALAFEAGGGASRRASRLSVGGG